MLEIETSVMKVTNRRITWQKETGLGDKVEESMWEKKRKKERATWANIGTHENEKT